MKVLEWLQLQEQVFVHSHISIQHFETTGRGIGTTQCIPTNTLLLSIPKHLCIHILQFNSVNNSFLQTYFDNLHDLVHNYIPSHGIAFVMLFFILQQLYPSQEYQSYIDSLPLDFTSSLYTISQEEEPYLPDTLLEKHLEKKTHFSKYSSQLKECIDQYLKPQYRTACHDSSLIQWSYFIYNTRSVYMNIPNISKENQFAMVPFLDMLNHSVVPNCEVIPTEDAYQVVTREEVLPFQQLCFTYGNHDNYKLFVEYGFIVPNNPHQAFVISKKKFSQFLQHTFYYENYPLLHTVLPLLKQNKLLQKNVHVEYCILGEGSVGWKLLGALKVLYLQKEQLQHPLFKKWLQEMDLSETELDKSHEQRVRRGIVKLCQYLLHTYESLEQFSFKNEIIKEIIQMEKQMLQTCIAEHLSTEPSNTL